MAGKSAIPGSPGKHCRQSERNNQKKIAELHDWVFSFFPGVCLWNRDDVHCTAINTLYTRLGGEYLRRWAARSQAGHLLHNFCGSALRQPKLVHQPTLTNQHQQQQAMRARLWLWNCLTLVVRHIHRGPNISNNHDCWYSKFLESSTYDWIEFFTDVWPMWSRSNFIGHNWNGSGDKTE